MRQSSLQPLAHLLDPPPPVSHNKAMIEVSSLTKTFRDFKAVDHISFSVKPAEVFGFLGPNGAGKTTTINMLCTLLPPSSGKATLNGFDSVKQAHEVRAAIGLVFQDPSLDERLTGWENLEFHGWLYNLKTEPMHKRMKELLDLMELIPWAHKKVKSYSGGMKRRLEIARGFLHFPKILFLDEPTLGLDPQTRGHVWEYLHRIREKEGTTLFLTTHYLEEAEHCDRIAIIDHGKIIALDTPHHLKKQIGGNVILLKTESNPETLQEIQQGLNAPAILLNGHIQVEVERAETFLPKLIRHVSKPILEIKLKQPTLEDVFLKLTGRKIREEEGDGKGWMRAVAR